ncbi:extracellular solute-binding protein [Palleronia sp. THAF1]|uniref:extracellular solute-binding protein n=1 Tax=Palleronia sp. THAF1 TaxID=2587842 RepID=UPI0020C81D11|nr:extracellular solute-binding protein [Palleronia sp. THAF1]
MTGLPGVILAEPMHGVAMFGDPALEPGFNGLPHANPDAPQGGRIVAGEVGSFDSLNPHILKGNAPWMLRFLAYESLMGRNYDEPFSLYGLLAETIEVADDGSWVEFQLRPEARFSDGSPVTPEDVLWSYETLGTEGHPRYRGAWAKVESAEQVGERGVRFTFNVNDRELALIMGMRPILKKAQWDGLDFADSNLDEIPISSAPYTVSDYEAGRFVTLTRNPDYWGADVPFMQGQANLDEIRMEFYGDSTAMTEAFKGGALTTMRETNAERWATQYDFPRVQSGEVVKSEIEHQRPSGIVGLAMNTREAPFDDWRVREAMIQAFNFEFANQVLNGGKLPRITSYFSNSELGMSHDAATGRVAELLEPYAQDLLPGTIEGYALPVSDGTERNRGNARRAVGLLEEAGYTIGDGGVLRGEDGAALKFDILLQQGSNESQQVTDLFVGALGRLGITPTITVVDSAQFTERTNRFDFDMTWYQRGLSLSPGNEQLLYWGADAADQEGSRNWMGVKSPAIDGLVQTMLSSEDKDDYVAAVRALDRVLTAGRYVIPVWYNPVSYIAHDASLKFPDQLPAYGDWFTWQPDFWWYEE